MKKLFIALALFACLLPQPASSAELTIEDVMEASCRVTAGNSKGTGTVIGEDDENFIVITNGHVVHGERGYSLEFWQDGYQSNPFPAKLEWYTYESGTNSDVAILTVPKKYFGNHPPRVIPLAAKDYAPKNNDELIGGSCPHGQPVMGWKARCLKNLGSTVTFNHSPIPGQSGTGIVGYEVDENGEKQPRIVTLLAWRVGEGKYGAGVSVKRVWELLSGDRNRQQIEVKWTELADKAKTTPLKEADLKARCKHCTVPYGQHLILPDGKGGLDKNGESFIFCPYTNLAHKGIRIDRFLEHVKETEWCNGPFCFGRHPRYVYPQQPQQPQPIPQQPKPEGNGGGIGGWIGRDKLLNGLKPSDALQKIKDELAAAIAERDRLKGLVDSGGKSLLDLKSQLDKATGSHKEKESIWFAERTKLDEELKAALAAQAGLNGQLETVTKEKDALDKERQGLVKANEKLTGEVALKEGEVAEAGKHYLDDATGGNGNLVENTSFAAAAAVGVPLAMKYGPVLLSLLSGTRRRRKEDEEDDEKSENGVADLATGAYNPVELIEMIAGILDRREGDKEAPRVSEIEPAPIKRAEALEHVYRHEGVVEHRHGGQVDHRMGDVPQFMMMPEQLPQGRYVGEMENQSANWYPAPSTRPVGLPPQLPNIPFSTRKKVTSEQIMATLSEIVEEYRDDQTLTTMQMHELLKQRLKMKYGVE